MSTTSRNPTPYAGTRNDVTRYEIWRLPAVEGEESFGSVALVADIDAKSDLTQQMGDQISDWRDALSDDDRHPWPRRPNR